MRIQIKESTENKNNELAKRWMILKSDLMNTEYIKKIKFAMIWLDLLVRGGEEK